MHFPKPTLFALAGLLFCAACREAKVHSYRVPKEAAQPPPLSFDMSGSGATASDGAAATDSESAPALRWEVPESWAALPPVSMRIAGYRLSRADASGGTATAELTITAFPGDVGGDLANINRWRGQIGLPPISTEALPAAIQRLRTAQGHEFKLVEMTNAHSTPTAQSTLAAYTEHEGSTWFFKLTGAPALVASEEPAFLAFLRTIQPR